MSLKYTRWIIRLLGITLLVLICIQGYWILHTRELEKSAIQRDIIHSLESVIREVEQSKYCFEMNARTRILPGEGVYTLLHRWDKDHYVNGGVRDTVPLFSIYTSQKDTHIFSARDLSFSYPTDMEMTLRFEMLVNDSVATASLGRIPDINKIDKRNYFQVFKDTTPISRKINTHLLDSLLRRQLLLLNLDTAQLNYGFRKSGTDSFLFTHAASNLSALKKSPLKAEMFSNNKYQEPHELLVYVADPGRAATRSILLVLSISALVILLLIAGFIYFIRIIYRQKKLSEMKTDFVNNMTHEFKTPITNIGLALETLGERLPSTDAYLLRILQEENNHLKENVDRILQIALMDREHLQLAPEIIDLHELIHRVARNFEMQVQALGGNIHFDLKAGMHKVEGDETHLVNVFYNLIDNAMKYNQRPPEIWIRSDNQGGKLIVYVTDNGIGMSPEVQRMIFDKFYRAGNGNLHDVKGFGLGLSYVKKIMQAHHGNIQVQSEPGKGSTFTVTFNKSQL